MSSGLRAIASRTLADLTINVGFARAVLDGTVEGELWSDRTIEPCAFHVVHPHGMSLVWGPDVAAVAHGVARRIRDRAARGDGEWLQIDPRWDAVDWDLLLGAGDDAVPGTAQIHSHVGTGDVVPTAGGRSRGAVRHARVNFTFDPAAFAARAPARSESGRLNLRHATEADYAWDGRVAPWGFWPDAATFLARGGGRVVEVDGTPAAIAFSAFHWDDVLEIGIETAPDFRRQGLATVVAEAMIEDVLAAGLRPVWSCRESNIGSVRLAQSLGFTPSRRLPYFEMLPRPLDAGSAEAQNLRAMGIDVPEQ